MVNIDNPEFDKTVAAAVRVCIDRLSVDPVAHSTRFTIAGDGGYQVTVTRYRPPPVDNANDG